MIYVDEPKYYSDVSGPAKRWGHMWSHLWADFEDIDNLHVLALKIGLKRKNFQEKSINPHYDLIPYKRVLAIRCGAIPYSFKMWYRAHWDEVKRRMECQ